MKGNPRFARPARNDLQVVPLHLPRGWTGPRAPWELERGFRVRVVTERVLVVTLGVPARPSEPRPPEAVISHGPQAGEESLVVVPAPRGPAPEAVTEAMGLSAREGWAATGVLVLSDRRQLSEGFGGLRRAMAAAAKTAGLPAAWVLQDMPEPLFRGVPYFTVEQSLRQLARVGRRLGRRARWRNLLPW